MLSPAMSKKISFQKEPLGNKIAEFPHQCPCVCDSVLCIFCGLVWFGFWTVRGFLLKMQSQYSITMREVEYVRYKVSAGHYPCPGEVSCAPILQNPWNKMQHLPNLQDFPERLP